MSAVEGVERAGFIGALAHDAVFGVVAPVNLIVEVWGGYAVGICLRDESGEECGFLSRHIGAHGCHELLDGHLIVGIGAFGEGYEVSFYRVIHLAR